MYLHCSEYFLHGRVLWNVPFLFWVAGESDYWDQVPTHIWSKMMTFIWVEDWEACQTDTSCFPPVHCRLSSILIGPWLHVGSLIKVGNAEHLLCIAPALSTFPALSKEAGFQAGKEVYLNFWVWMEWSTFFFFQQKTMFQYVTSTTEFAIHCCTKESCYAVYENRKLIILEQKKQRIL